MTERQQPVRVALIDDHELVREGLWAWLAAETDQVTVLASADSVRDLRATAGWGAEVVLLDLALNDGSTVEDNVATLLAAGSRVVVVSQNEEPSTVRSALRAGALGYVPKASPATEIVQAVLAAAQGQAYMTQALAIALLECPDPGRPQLSSQELRTLQLYAGGMPMKSVARRLGIELGTVKSYVDRIREKYQRFGRDAPTKVDLYRRAVEDGYLPDAAE